MSTRRVNDEAQAARKALGDLADAADKAVRELEREKQQKVKELGRIVRGAQVATQQVNDEIGDLDEQLSQLNASDPEPPAPAEPAADNSSNDNSNSNTGNGNDAGNQPTAAPPAEPYTLTRNNLNPRNWRFLAWLLALVGAVVGVIIARASYDPMWSNVTNDFWHGLLVVLWFIALMAAGFLTGGWWGATLEEEHDLPEEEHNVPEAA
jgi:hypothetical protein